MVPALRATTMAVARARFRHGRDRGDVAGAAEIFGQRPRHRVVDLELREKRVGAEQGGIRPLPGIARKVDDAVEHVRPRQFFRLTMRSTERRAFSAIAGSITTSSFM